MIPNQSNSRFEIGILYLIFQIIDVGLNDIPIVTLTTMIGQIVLYMRIIKLPWTTYEVCINVLSIVGKKDYRRLFLAPFEHANDMHLYYNMMSYLVKGRYLEKKYGSMNFLFLMLVMTVASTSIDVALCFILSRVLRSQYLMSACGIGFSGVLYAFKVIIYMETAHLPWGINGIPVASKYIAWLELFVFHLLTPDASFIGHLAGLLAGVIYTGTPIGFFLDMMISKITSTPFGHNYEDNNDVLF